MSFSTDVRDELMSLKMWDVNSNLKQEEQIARLQLREAFIKSGSITDPNKEYHLEVLFKTKKKAVELQNLLLNFEIQSRVIKKGNGYITYIKNSEDIVSFLALIGANRGVLRFEEIRVLKDARNNVNRIVNCETANLNKTLGASENQIKAIKRLKKSHKFNYLPEELKEVAEIRLKNPISKSGVSHRLNKIIRMEKEQKDE